MRLALLYCYSYSVMYSTHNHAQAEGIHELQAGQREIQERQEEFVTAQQSSEIQQRFVQIKQTGTTTSQASIMMCVLYVVTSTLQLL